MSFTEQLGHPSPGEASPGRRLGALAGRPGFWTAFGLLTLLSCLPFLTTATPPLLDYPNHLARIFILTHWAGDPFLREHYQPHWQPLPNLAFDGLGVALSAVLPIYLAGRAVLIAAVLLLASGVAALSAALHGGRPRPFCLLAFLFLFSEPFAWGFISLILGFGLALWGVAAWVRLRDRPLPLVLAWSAPFALLLFFAHLFAFASYGLVIACIELARLRDAARPLRALGRSLLAGVGQFALPAAVFLLASPTPLDSNSTQFGILLDRLRAMPLAPVRNYDDWLDVLAALATAVIVVAGLWTRRLRVAREMRLALIVLAVLCFLIPHRLSTSDNAEIRLPVITVLLLAASGDWAARSRRELLAGGVALLALFGLRTATTVDAFAEGSRFIAEIKAALASVPEGTRIASMAVTNPENHRMSPAWEHAICYEVIEKSAFVPSLFASPEQQPVLLGADDRGRPFPPSHYVSRPGQALPASLFERLDYVVVVNPGALRTDLPPNLHLVATGRQFRVYRVGG